MIEVIPSSDKNFLTATNLKILFGSKTEKKNEFTRLMTVIDQFFTICLHLSVWQECQIACGSL